MSLDKFFTEDYMCEYMNIDKKQLRYLRVEKGIPHIVLSKTIRMYFEDDICAWLLSKKTSSDSI